MVVKKEKKLTEEERKLEAEWFFCQGLMKDMVWVDDSKTNWESKKNTYLQGKVSYETWKRWFKENPIHKDSINNLSEKIGVKKKKKELAKRIIKIQPLFYDKSCSWWLWDWEELKWGRVDETDILNAVDKYAIVNSINSKEKIEILESLKQAGRLNIPKPIQPTWIQFKDIIYDVKTGNEIRATPDFFITNPIPYELDKDHFSETPVMDKIFKEWVGEEYVETLYEIIAYCLLPNYPIHRIFCFIGEGLNGKSCFLRLINKFIGSDNCCSTELDTLLKSRFEMTKLYKKLICQMGETDFNEMTKTSILKKLTGQDLIGFEYKNKELFDDVNYAKILIATNNLPTTTDKTIGFYRRWLIIDFPNKFSEKKDILETIPEEEYNALALKCSLILGDLLKNRKFTNEGSVEERMEKYESKSNFLEKFISEFTIQEIGSHITKSDFYKKFGAWCKENRHREMAENSVGKEMKKLGIDAGKKYFSWLFEGKGGQLKIWRDIKWKD